jgi:hypothetical protein
MKENDNLDILRAVLEMSVYPQHSNNKILKNQKKYLREKERITPSWAEVELQV